MPVLEQLYAIPSFTLLLAAVGAAIVVAGLGQAMVHGLLGKEALIEHTEVGGILIAVAGTLYAVVLGFLTVVVWQDYVDARQLTVLESNANIDAWHSSVGLPEAIRTRVRDDMMNYADVMVKAEWPAMRKGKEDPRPAMIAMDAIDAVATFVPSNPGEENAQQSTMQELTELHDARQQRVAINLGGVSQFEWTILALGGVTIVAFCWLFGLRNARVQFVMTASVVTIIVSTLVLLFELQYPFRSDAGVGPDAWVAAKHHLEMMRSGEMPGMR